MTPKQRWQALRRLLSHTREHGPAVQSRFRAMLAAEKSATARKIQQLKTKP